MLQNTALALLIAALWAAGPSQADPLSPEYLTRFGGTYSADCSDAKADRLTILADRLIFASGNRELVASDIFADVYFWGRQPPDDFEIALMGELEPDRGLLFLVYSDKQGLYIRLDGHPDVLNDIGHSPEDVTRYYMCDSSQ